MTILRKTTTRLLMCSLLASGLSLPLFAKRSSFPNDFVLTDALQRPSQTFTSPTVSISNDGSQVYLVYAVSETPGGILAELFNNSNGTLTTAQTLTLSTTQPNDYFPIVVGGWASPDFTKFSVLDAVITGPNSVDGRVRILDNNFNDLVLPRIISFTGLDFPSLLGHGGVFSEDGKYLSFTVSTGRPYSTTTFYVLNTSDLSTAAQTTINAASSLDVSQWITLECKGKKDYYVTFLSCQGFYSPNFTPGFEVSYQPPYFIQVYKVNVTTGSIDLVAESPLPKFADVNTLDVMGLSDKGLIAHGGFCSLFPNQLSIYVTNDLKKTSLPFDNAEARVLEFDGKTLKVIFKQALNCCNRTLFYPPAKGRTFMVGQNAVTNVNGNPQTQTTMPEYYVLANIGCKNGKEQFVPLNLPRQDVSYALPKFSNDGKWFIRAGAFGYFNGDPNVDAIGIQNVLLFKVI